MTEKKNMEDKRIKLKPVMNTCEGCEGYNGIDCLLIRCIRSEPEPKVLPEEE